MTDVSGIPPTGIFAPPLGLSSGLLFAQNTTDQTNQFNQNQANLTAQSQNTFNNVMNNLATQGPASNYGKVIPYPSFGEPFGGNNPKWTFAPGSNIAVGSDIGIAPWGSQPIMGGQNNQQIFNAPQYLALNKDVWEAGADPWKHYSQFGQNENREGAWSNPNEVAWNGLAPANQGMDTFFNSAPTGIGGGNDNMNELAASYYLGNKDVYAAAIASGQDPAAFAMNHLKNFGVGEGRSIFDADEYLRQNQDVAAAGANPYEHYQQFGEAEGRFSPLSRAFDPEKYREYNQDVADAGVDPWTHYTTFGLQEGREGGFEGGGFNSDPNFDTAGYFKAHPDDYRAFLQNANYTDPTAYAEMSNYQSPSNDYKTFQRGPTYDWQSSIPENLRDPRVINEVYRSAGETKLPPHVIAAVFNTESRWKPADRLASQYGIPQMSEIMWGDNPFKGRMGGVDFNTFKNDPVGDKQIRAYTDWLIRGNKLNRHGLDVAAQTDPVMQAAMLQAIQFAGNPAGWRTSYLQGDRDVYVTTEHPQAKELRPGGESYPTLNSMYKAYDKVLGSWKR